MGRPNPWTTLNKTKTVETAMTVVGYLARPFGAAFTADNFPKSEPMTVAKKETVKIISLRDGTVEVLCYRCRRHARR